MIQFKKDTAINVEFYRVAEYRSSPRPFEGHHINSIVKLDTLSQNISFSSGDYYIPLNQFANRFLIETLEPSGEEFLLYLEFFRCCSGPKKKKDFPLSF